LKLKRLIYQDILIGIDFSQYIVLYKFWNLIRNETVERVLY